LPVFSPEGAGKEVGELVDVATHDVLDIDARLTSSER
jgi:hypothetical protein